ncbi:PPPDE putative peptidase domain-containing protein [Artemisia annua]|uniref:PPPDE putative peptidase domain-containing protein n=1 Tax=Artemisia annua TaxID=35608 RepID=A0A2U1L306_ARTAN|nr:PPPDE putative peptidase domain-containing protein [Artemisia annua]
MGTNDGFVDREVFLNVYDLTPFNDYSIWFGFGVFHTGIEVYGMEYGFGAHDYSISGVFEVEPRSCPGFMYRCSISLGHLDMSASEFREFIETMASDYHGDTYHLISKNCNHFTDDITQRLTGQRIPGWVNRLAKLGSICSCLLPDSLESSTVKQMPEYHAYEDAGSDFGSNASSPTASENDEVDQKVLLSTTQPAEVSFIKETQRFRSKVSTSAIVSTEIVIIPQSSLNF